ncbi:hypothetical protein RK21_00655 [Pseudomonas plecoglossicida]|nr:hypothetical protein RK21_00655 [Pseudomonas plecoglossicida]
MLTHLGTSRCRNEIRVLATNAPKGRASYAVRRRNALEGRGFCGLCEGFLPNGDVLPVPALSRACPLPQVLRSPQDL